MKSLKDTRKILGFSQEDIARTTGKSQGEVSRLEKRNDMLVNTLRSYIEAMGGTVKIIASFEQEGYKQEVEVLV